MLKKILIIELCDHCPHFDNEYYEYNHQCILTEKYIEQNDKWNHSIPEDCPLPDAKNIELTKV